MLIQCTGGFQSDLCLFDLLCIIKIAMQQQQLFEEFLRFALMIRVVNLESVKSRKHLSQFWLQIQQMFPYEGYNIPQSSKRTKPISKINYAWMEDFYYNNCEYNNNFQFSMHTEEDIQFEEVVIIGEKIFNSFKNEGVEGTQSLHLRFKDHGDSQVTVLIEISVFSNEDCLTGLHIPDISLSNISSNASVPQYTAIQIKKTPRVNCFSCMDQPITDFDRLEYIPSKFKKRNIVKQLQ